MGPLQKAEEAVLQHVNQWTVTYRNLEKVAKIMNGSGNYFFGSL
jgi:hypothetical protein